jgi:cytochrome c oxidase subunit II
MSMGDGAGRRSSSSGTGPRAGGPTTHMGPTTALVALVGLAGAASAHSAGAVETHAYDRLLVLVLIIGTAIAAFVFAVIIVGVWRYRETSDFPRGVPKEHDRWLESAWTAVPIVILVVLAALSTQALIESDTPPENAITIEVLGVQWQWVITYPDGNISINDCYVEEGQHVIFEIRSADVVHSFFLPDFNLKVDAFPNETYETWIHADRVGEFDMYCAEFCGLEHGEMQGTLHVFPKGSQPLPYGPPPGQEPPPPPPVQEVSVELGVDGTGSQPPRFVTSPTLVSVPLGANVTMLVRNNTTRTVAIAIGPPYALGVEVAPEGLAWLNFTADRPTAGDPIGVQVQGGDGTTVGSRLVVGAEGAATGPSGGGGGGGSNSAAWALALAAALLLAFVLLLALRAPTPLAAPDAGRPPEGEDAPKGGGGDV